MKTENTEYPIQNLLSMTDFVLDLEKKVYDGDLVFQKLGVLASEYAKFLKKPLKIEMFIPDDEYGFEKVLFPGFKVQETPHGLEIFGHGVSVRFAIENKCLIESFCMHELPLSQVALKSIFNNLLSQ